MNVRLIILFCFISHYLIGQVEYEYWEGEDSIKRSEISYIKNKKEGKAFYWYKNGKKEAEIFYKNDIQIGEFRYWYPNGTLKREGEVIRYDTIINPPKFEIIRYDIVNYWYPNGKISVLSKKEKNYIYRKEFYENGKIKKRGKMNLEGEKNGIWKSWNEKGVLLRIEKYKQDKLIKEKVFP